MATVGDQLAAQSAASASSGSNTSWGGGSYGPATAPISQGDTGDTTKTSTAGRQSVIGGDASARTALGGGSGGGGSGGGGGGGGGGGYSIGASLADSGTFALTTGDIDARGGSAMFGELNSNFGGTQTTGLSGKVLGWVGIAAAGLLALVLLLWRKG